MKVSLQCSTVLWILWDLPSPLHHPLQMLNHCRTSIKTEFIHCLQFRSCDYGMVSVYFFPPMQQLNFRLTDLRTTGDWLWLFFCGYEPGGPSEVDGDAVLEKYLQSFPQLCVFIAQTSEHVSALSGYLSKSQSCELLSSLELSDCTGWLVFSASHIELH